MVEFIKMIVVDYERYFIALFLLITFDFISGFIKGIKTVGLDSKSMSNGVLKKLAELMLCIVAIIFSYLFDNKLIVYGVVGFLCVMEGISVLENVTELGAPVPNFLTQLLKIKRDMFDNIDVGE